MSDDPTLVDTATLQASLRRDVGTANAKLREASDLLGQAMVTAWELQRRADDAYAAETERVMFGDPQDPNDLRPLHERVIRPKP
jgi:hypothetical protein